jgi:hypothetical protein
MVLSSHREETVRRLAAPDIAARKGGVPIVCLTAYTAPVAAAWTTPATCCWSATRWAWWCTACPTPWA